MHLRSKTKEEFWSGMIAHLATQQQRAATSEGMCRYRTKSDMRCAIGWDIPDEEYKPSIEKCNVDVLIRAKELTTDLPTQFLVECQMAHDDSRSLEELHLRLKDIAHRWILDGTIVAHIKSWKYKVTVND